MLIEPCRNWSFKQCVLIFKLKEDIKQVLVFSSLVWYLAWWPRPAAKFTTWKSGQDHLVFIILVSSSSSRRSYCWARSPLATCPRRGRHPSGHHPAPARTPGWRLRWRSSVSTLPGRSGTKPGTDKVLSFIQKRTERPLVTTVGAHQGWLDQRQYGGRFYAASELSSFQKSSNYWQLFG